MFQLHSTPPPRRSGVILLIVVVMLGLFLVVGLSFMLYAESEASASRIYREAFTINYDRADIDPGDLLQWALGQLVYDTSDYGDGVYSAMRGHSLARNMYGWNFTSAPPDLVTGNYLGYDPRLTNVELSLLKNTTAFNGVGQITDTTVNPPPPGIAAPNDQLLNYMYFPGDGFLRDPERLNVRQSGSPLDTPTKVRVDDPSKPPNYSGGWNPPYTYPDNNSRFLAVIQPRDPNYGNQPSVIVPSFHRAAPGTPFFVAQPDHFNLPATSQAPWLNTSDPSLKYRVLRPRPVDMYYNPSDPKSFPLPASDTGDVQNLPGGRGFDSFWMDLGYPAQTTRGGTKFKPLFAFTVVDLDGRVNLNVHGNNHGKDSSGQPTHESNQGLGRNEVNLNRVLTAAPNEVKFIFGDPASGAIGRYGPNYQPSAVVSGPLMYPDLPVGELRPYMTPLDYDGIDENGNPTQRFALASNALRTMPDYTGVTGYDSLITQTSRTANPLLYNVLDVGRPGNDDTPFSMSENLYYLVGMADSSPNYKRSALYQLGLRANLDSDPAIRQMLTTHSYDLDTPGAQPWVTNPNDPGNSSTAYVLPPPAGPTFDYHAHGAAGFQLSQAPSTINNGSVKGSDFLPNDGRTRVLPRIDLNRKLTPYPTNPLYYKSSAAGGQLPKPPNAGTVPPLPTVDPTYQYYRAEWERQKFAREIFDRLVQATGAVPSGATPPPNADQTSARRYLAQLAVNMVDYIDDDEFSTPFFWNDYNPNDVVFGVESPKVVLNEIYGEIRNAPNDPTAAQNFQVHFWVELYNTHQMAALPPSNPPGTDYNTDPVTGDNRGFAQLQDFYVDPNKKHPIYQVLVYEQQAGFTANDMRGLSNVQGTAGANLSLSLTAKAWDQTGTPPSALTMPERVKIHPNDGSSAGVPGQNVNGYYVVASENDAEDAAISQQPTNRLPSSNAPKPTQGLAYTEKMAATVPAIPNQTVLLQRLACPHLPPNPDPATGVLDPTEPFNPYVTVDYVTDVRVHDAVKTVNVGGLPQPHTGEPPANRKSKARTQPFAAATDVYSSGSPPATPHTFFSPNPQAGQFDWLIHLDRPPISPMELLHVSAFKPHEVTQTFQDPTQTVRHGHVAPWGGEKNRLYRALEYFTVGDRNAWTTVFNPMTPGVPQPSTGGRKPGMINVNTIWTQEVFNALADPQQQANFFQQSDVDAAWDAMRKHRLFAFKHSGNDTPYLSFAHTGPVDPTQPPTPAFPTTAGVGGTVLNGDFHGPTGATTNPYITQEMLRKIANNMTTRSNTFAVYLTVGFFEVMDDTVRPVKLGAEIRARNGLPIRHKMFAVVDRTKLAIDTSTPSSQTNGLVQGGVDATLVAKQQFFITCDQAVTSDNIQSRDVTSEMLGKQTTMSVVGGFPTGPDKFMYYEGKRFQIPLSPTTGTFILYADVGASQETLACKYDGSGNIIVQQHVDEATGNLMPGFGKTHAANFTLSYLRPGNPGPQGKVDYKADNFSQVIPYTVIIQ